MALPRRALLSSLAVAAAGCTAPDSSEPTAATASPATGSTTADSATEPGYATCDTPAADAEELTTTGGIPDSLSEDTARAYVTAVEKDIVLSAEDGENDGYVSIGSVAVESVEYGYLATVPVTGGYYNEDSDDATETVHYDLAPHTATYFINDQVLRRAKDATSELDPRKQGEVIVCEG